MSRGRRWICSSGKKAIPIRMQNSSQFRPSSLDLGGTIDFFRELGLELRRAGHDRRRMGRTCHRTCRSARRDCDDAHARRPQPDCPAQRTMSATFTGGRSCVLRLFSFSSCRECIQRTAGGAEMAPGQMQIDRRFLLSHLPSRRLPLGAFSFRWLQLIHSRGLRFRHVNC